MRNCKVGRKRKILMITAVTAVLLVAVFGAAALYLGDYYHADEAAIAAFAPSKDVPVEELADGKIVLQPEDAVTGLIFYPGGKVEHTAYLPLMKALAAEGILCVLVEMPFRLAVFDVNAADGITESYPQIENWYIGGHSLGGAMAASYLSEHTSAFTGLILLGAYSTADLSASDLAVLSVYGSEDGVMDRAAYEENRKNLPSSITETVIDGGCHAYFGMYGSQEGDGTPKVTNEEQILMTASAIARFAASNE